MRFHAKLRQQCVQSIGVGSDPQVLNDLGFNAFALQKLEGLAAFAAARIVIDGDVWHGRKVKKLKG
jgi:hypothetical protein